MRRLSCLAIGAALAAASAPAHATVWSFYETGISCFSGSCTLPPQPYVLMSLTLPSDTSSGSARWFGGGDVSAPPPVFTGDPFALTLPGVGELTSSLVAPPFDCARPGFICNFNISWSSTDAVLDNIRVVVHALDDDWNIGLGGGLIASDGPGTNGGCVNTQCSVTGSWVDSPQMVAAAARVAEPGSLSILAAAFLTLLGRRRRRLAHTDICLPTG